ncbi:MAG TPA: nucleotidyltransferase domain-containing protein, partial [Kofleriaceae bacterium]
MTLDDHAAAVIRSREIIAPWLERSGVVGAYLAGSATRPHADRHSDLDIIVVVEDPVYAALPAKQRSVTGIDRGPPRRKEYDLQVISIDMLAARRTSTADHLRFYCRHAHVLFDPTHGLAPLLRELGELTPELAHERLRVHYYDFLACKEQHATSGQRTDSQLSAARALIALMKSLFVAARSWVPKVAWMPQELRELGVPERLVDRIEAAWTGLSLGPFDAELD